MFHIRVVHFFGTLKRKVIIRNIYAYFLKKNISQAYLIQAPKLDVPKIGIPLSKRTELPPGYVKLVINNAPYTFVYPNTINTYLTFNHLLFDRKLLCYFNTTSTVFRNLTVLSNTTNKINRISNHFCHRWRHEYVVNLCETQRALKLNINSQKIMFCQLMMKRCPDTFGELPQ